MKQMQGQKYKLAKKVDLEIQHLEKGEAPLTPGKLFPLNFLNECKYYLYSSTLMSLQVVIMYFYTLEYLDDVYFSTFNNLSEHLNM